MRRLILAAAAAAVLAVPATAQATLGQGGCANGQQYQVNGYPNGTEVGQTNLISVTVSSTSASWSLNYTDPNIDYCATLITLSDGSTAWIMPLEGQSYAAPSGLTITSVVVMAHDDANGDPVGSSCATPYTVGFSSPNQWGGVNANKFVITPSSGPYTSTADGGQGISIKPVPGVLLCQVGGNDSDGSSWGNYGFAEGITHDPAAGAQVSDWLSDAMDQPTPRDLTTLPTVSLTAPANGQTVSGSVQVAATSNDEVGSTVQLQLDGANLGPASPVQQGAYSINWDTTRVSNGQHTLTAIATDVDGNTSSQSVTVTVNNASGCPPGEHRSNGRCVANPPAKCVVPRLKGKTRGQAKVALMHHHCRLGSVHKPKRQRGPHHHLVIGKQSPAPGTRKPSGFRVAVWLVWRKPRP